MIFGQDRHELRKMYAEAWKKQLAGQPMSPLELQIAAVVAQHPEYHVATDRPAGIAKIYEALAARDGDPHAAEHRIIECLAETLWEAQSANRAPDEALYLERLRRL
jgi:glucokinase